MLLDRVPEGVRVAAKRGECPCDLDITIIIVSYNTRQQTIDCLRSVRTSTSASSYEIIVVDNASEDGSAEALYAAFPDLDVIASSENLGFAAANNLAEQKARGRRILLLNPDTVIVDNAIDELHQFALSNPDCGIWGGRTLNLDGSLSRCCAMRMTLWNTLCYGLGISFLFNHPKDLRGWKHDTVRTVDVISGCFLLIDRNLWRQLNGFDPLFFMYGEDEDLCLRACDLGARPTFTPTATIIHHGAASEHDEAEKRIKLMAGEITVMKRHWSVLSAFMGRLNYIVLPHPRWMIYSLTGLITRRPNLRRKAAVWWRVWQCRQRWIGCSTS